MDHKAKIRRVFEEQERSQKAAVEQFLVALSDGDPALICHVFIGIDNNFASEMAWQALIDSDFPISKNSASSVLLRIWEHGDDLREEAGGSAVFAQALRKILLPYIGPDIKLWRGDTAFNHEHKSYGLT